MFKGDYTLSYGQMVNGKFDGLFRVGVYINDFFTEKEAKEIFNKFTDYTPNIIDIGISTIGKYYTGLYWECYLETKRKGKKYVRDVEFFLKSLPEKTIIATNGIETLELKKTSKNYLEFEFISEQIHNPNEKKLTIRRYLHNNDWYYYNQKYNLWCVEYYPKNFNQLFRIIKNGKKNGNNL